MPIIGASVRRIVGISAGRTVRADQPFRCAARLRAISSTRARSGNRRAHRLGARPFPDRRARPRPLRRHRALRTRRSAPGLPSRLEHADLQFRPQRSRELPARQRAILARKATTSTGCASMRSPRCCISITAAKRANGFPTATAAARISKRSLSCSTSTASLRRDPGHHHGRRRVDRLPRRVQAGRVRRPGFRLQMEHGLDARYAATTCARIRSTAAIIRTS